MERRDIDLDFFNLTPPIDRKGYPEEEAKYLSLFGAILVQAIRDYLAAKNPKNKNKKTIQRDGTQAEIWIFHEKVDNLHLLYEFNDIKGWRLAVCTSFEHICTLFDIDPDYLREKILEFVEKRQYYTLGRRYGY